MSPLTLLLLAAAAAVATADCGKRLKDQHLDKLQQWVVGGVPALRGAYPYQVSFEYYDWYYGAQHICGGTLVDHKWVVTAAHCIVAGRGGSRYRVVVGLNDMANHEASAVRHRVMKVIVHPGWSGDRSNDMSNDIALVQLAKPVKFNDYVQPACLPDQVDSDSLYTPGAAAILSGWGEMDPKAPTQEEPGRMPTALQATMMPIIETEACANANEWYQQMVTGTMMCAGFMEGGVDGCQGDSGGPLVRVVDGRVTLIGVVSWGIGCAQEGFPGIYTNVSHELKFIRKHIH